MKSSKRSLRRVIVVAAAPLSVLLFTLVGWCFVTEAPPPDTRDLTFRTRPVTKVDNGIELLRFSKDDLYWPRGEERFMAVLKGEAWHGDVVEEVLEKNAPLIERLERSLETTDFVWTREYDDYLSESGPGGPSKSFLVLYRLPRVLYLRAQAAHREGAHERALADAFTLIEFSQKLKRSQKFLFYLTHLAERWGYRQMVTTLSESNPDAELVRASLDRLKESEPRLRAAQEGIRNCYEGTAERVDELIREGFRDFLFPFESWAVSQASTLFFKPEATKNELAKILRQTIHHLDSGDLSVPFPTFDRGDAPFLVAYNPRSQELLEDHRQVQIQLSLLTERVDHGLAILFLALKAHHLDHGRLPERLEELVPTYVSELPVDPFSGKPLRYDRVKMRIYSTGIHAPSRQEGATTVALPGWFNRESLVLGLKVTGAPGAQVKVNDPVFSSFKENRRK